MLPCAGAGGQEHRSKGCEKCKARKQEKVGWEVGFPRWRDVGEIIGKKYTTVHNTLQSK